MSDPGDEIQRRDKRAREYFRDELNYLRGMGHLFGLANPSIAGLLIERGSDPDVERLLEGFAFLTARIHQRVDDAVPEVVHGLAELLLPHSLRPLPACSIVEFTPQLRALRARARIPAGAELGAVPVEGTSCTFRTTVDVELLPLAVVDAVLDRASVTAPVLRLFFQTTEQGRAEVFKPGGLRLFINAELSAGALILLWLARYCRGVEVRSPSGSPLPLGPGAVRPIGFDRTFPLLPWPRASDGYRVLQEYFTLPQKFLFFEVRGLEAASALPGERFEVAFQLDRPPPLDMRITRDMFRLHCAPVVNLFRTPADPIFRHTLEREHLMRAADLPPEHMEIYSVDEVVGVRVGRSERRRYRPFHDFSHAEAGGDPAFYRLRRVPSPLDGGTDTYLAIDSPRDVPPAIDIEETLSIELTCTNRALPAQLQVGDLCRATSSSPTNAGFRNLLGVTRPARAPLGSELHWRLLSHLAINARSLAEADALRRLLELYNFQALADVLTGRANQNRIDSLQAISARPLTRFLEGTPVRGHQVVVDVDESNFVGPGDAFLFGCILDELFAANVTLNSFTELALRLQPSQTEFRWSPRNGSLLIS